MRFAYLGSGSKGNGALIEAGATRLLLDCGFSARETLTRLERAGVAADGLDGILVTHEHNDHIAGVGAVARKLGLPVWLTAGTARAAAGRLGDLPETRLFDPHSAFPIGDIQVEPFPVPHDAAEPTQFVFGDGRVRLGILTDVGSTTAHILGMLDGCDALALECNHDERMLLQGPYPPALKQRVSSDLGHLSNTAAAGLLSRLDTDRLQHLVAVHISETNNSPALAAAALAAVMGYGSDTVAVADQNEGLDWCTIEH